MHPGKIGPAGMRRTGRIATTTARLGGGVAYAAMAAGLLLGPILLMGRRSPEAPARHSAGAPPEARTIERVIDVEGWASEGFDGLKAEVESRPGVTSWAELRGLMEARGCTALRYTLLFHLRMNDGSLEDLAVIRRPYEQPQHAVEFLRYLRGGPRAVARIGDGPPPWEPAEDAQRGGDGEPEDRE